MNILDKLNSGELHAKARAARPDCVDATGGIHNTPERARFVDWAREAKNVCGENVAGWPSDIRAEYDARYVPSR